jgi:hypothetical protein
MWQWKTKGRLAICLRHRKWFCDGEIDADHSNIGITSAYPQMAVYEDGAPDNLISFAHWYRCLIGRKPSSMSQAKVKSSQICFMNWLTFAI